MIRILTEALIIIKRTFDDSLNLMNVHVITSILFALNLQLLILDLI